MSTTPNTPRTTVVHGSVTPELEGLLRRLHFDWVDPVSAAISVWVREEEVSDRDRR